MIVLLDAASGRRLARVAANGVVDAAVTDGRGGWFVAGSFTRLGKQRHIAVAHVLGNGAVDGSWQGSVGSASGRAVSVQALARGGRRLYVAGAFGRVGGLHRPGLGALDTGSGIRGWRPRPLLWLDVGALLATGPRILVAGQFNYPTAGITALDARTGALDRGWNPHLRPIGDAGSFSTLLRHGGRVYVAGSFRVAGLRRNGPRRPRRAQRLTRPSVGAATAELLRLQPLRRALRARRRALAPLGQRRLRAHRRRRPRRPRRPRPTQRRPHPPLAASPRRP